MTREEQLAMIETMKAQLQTLEAATAVVEEEEEVNETTPAPQADEDVDVNGIDIDKLHADMFVTPDSKVLFTMVKKMKEESEFKDKKYLIEKSNLSESIKGTLIKMAKKGESLESINEEIAKFKKEEESTKKTTNAGFFSASRGQFGNAMYGTSSKVSTAKPKGSKGRELAEKRLGNTK